MTISHSEEEGPRLTMDESYRPHQEEFGFSLEEVRSLWRIIKHQYISYEDTGAMAVGTKIGKIVSENELVK